MFKLFMVRELREFLGKKWGLSFHAKVGYMGWARELHLDRRGRLNVRAF